MKDFEFNFTDVLEVVQKYYYIIIGCVIFAVTLAVIGNQYIFKKIYQSSVTLYTWNSVAEGSQINSSTAYRDIMFYDRLVNDYKQILNSRRVTNAVEAILERERYGKLPYYHVSVTLKRNTRMIRINVDSTDPQLACDIANTTAEVFIRTIAELMTMNNIKIIDRAEVAKHYTRPAKVKNIIIAVFLGIVVGFGIGFILKLLDNTVKTPEDITSVFKLPLLGMVPEAPQPNKNNLFKRTGNVRRLLLVGDNYNNSPFAESFKVVRNNIQYSSPDNPLKVITVSSASPDEGKTTVCCNLAIAIAMSGKKILVIDCDLRKPTVHQIFNIENKVGTVDCLVHNVSCADAIQRGVVDGVDIMPAGPIPPNPSELLMAESFQSMITSLREQYDYIILDAPPATVNLADAAIVGRVSEGILLVMRAGYTRYDFAAHAIEQLLQVHGNKIVGAVLNRFNMNSHKYYINHYFDA